MTATDKTAHTNRLINETSPYLLQHAHNPVDWYPWGDEAFEKARKEDKLVLVSIGYAACHWCHVMEHESFEDSTVASVMNAHFVCIKVDREERPDVDHTYMDAVHIMAGQGGWPLNCFALPDGRPVFGGTYFRKDQWLSILDQLSAVYKKDKPRVIRSAEEVMKGIRQINLVKVNTDTSDFSKNDLAEAIENWKPKFDKTDGGNAGAPKFPMPANYLLLLKYFYHTGDEEVLAHLELSLDKMASSGIFDLLGGGFARYSTDALWKVPHFEKMLYDNAQLVSVYSIAFKLFQKEAYRKTVAETMDFIAREMTAENGAFYASIDADSEGEEGTFYIWKKEEIDAALGEDAAVFNFIFNITEAGNWEHRNNVIHTEKSIDSAAAEFGLEFQEVEQVLNRSREKLFVVRAKRERPLTDDKILTSWNALMISGCVEAYRAFGEQAYLEMGLRAAKYLKDHCVTSDGEVYRMVREQGNITGFLDDYALLARAFLDLYSTTFDEDWLSLSERIASYTQQHFFDLENGMFFYADLDKSGTVSQKYEVSDNVIPASNSVMAAVLFELSHHLGDTTLENKAKRMMANALPMMKEHANYYANWGLLLSQFVYKTPEVVFAGANASVLKKGFQQKFTYALVAGSSVASDLPLLKGRYPKEGSLIYVCQHNVCQLPVETVDEALGQMYPD